jgi:hypothetical protein
MAQDTLDHGFVVDQRNDAHLFLALRADPPTLKLRRTGELASDLPEGPP